MTTSLKYNPRKINQEQGKHQIYEHNLICPYILFVISVEIVSPYLKYLQVNAK